MTNRKELFKEFLNTHQEIHAFTLGIYNGLTEWRGADMPDNPDIKEEPHYYAGGYILGTMMRWGAIILFGIKVAGG